MFRFAAGYHQIYKVDPFFPLLLRQIGSNRNLPIQVASSVQALDNEQKRHYDMSKSTYFHHHCITIGFQLHLFCSVPLLYLKQCNFFFVCTLVFYPVALTEYCLTRVKLSLWLLCCNLANGLWIHPEVYISIYKSIYGRDLWNNVILEMCVCTGVYYRVCGHIFYRAGFYKDLLL